MKKLVVSTLAVLMVAGSLPLQAKESDDKEILYWVAPMDPNYRRDAPGKSPMGMDLVPVYKEKEAKSQSSGEKEILYWLHRWIQIIVATNLVNPQWEWS